MKLITCLRWVGVMLLCAGLAGAQEVTLRARVALTPTSGGKAGRSREANNVVVWLTPEAGTVKPVTFRQMKQPRLVQRNKSFDPHLLVVPVGSVVAFPNHDPFFHNVFSLFEGKRFDLGLYEAGTSRMVRFDRLGISYIFCNIHPEMSAVVITMATPLYAISNRDGQLSLAGVPYGRYMLHVWSQGMGPENP